VSTFVTVTLTFGTDAPDASLATPKIVPVGNWAATGMAAKRNAAAQIMLAYILLRYVPMFPPMARPLGGFRTAELRFREIKDNKEQRKPR
jgi:hypothetical protein